LLLTIEDIRQDTPHGCGEAAVRAVLAFHQITGAAPRISSPVDGVDPIALERALRKFGLRVMSGNMKLSDLKNCCDSLRPPICLVHWPDSSESHWIIVRGVSRGSVWFHDVETGPGRCRTDEWEKAWSANDGRMPFEYRNWAVVTWLP
jgi:predicted double-glycine peptidase